MTGKEFSSAIAGPLLLAVIVLLAYGIVWVHLSAWLR